MAEFTSCYSLVMELINEMSLKDSHSTPLNQERFKFIDHICELVDSLICGFECRCVRANINDITYGLTISIWCDELILQGEISNDFFSLIKMISSFSVSKSQDDDLRIGFNIDDIWMVKNG